MCVTVTLTASSASGTSGQVTVPQRWYVVAVTVPSGAVSRTVRPNASYSAVEAWPSGSAIRFGSPNRRSR